MNTLGWILLLGWCLSGLLAWIVIFKNDFWIWDLLLLPAVVILGPIALPIAFSEEP